MIQFRKPETIPLLFIIVATLLLAGLGVWQLERLQWKNGLIHSMQAAQTQPAVGSLPAEDKALNVLKWRKAVLEGSFVKDKAVRFIGHENGGYIWVVPFRLEDSDRIILVSEGWFPAGKEPPLTLPATGILRPANPPRLFSPGNRADLNVWFTEDFPALEKATGLKLAPLILDSAGTPNFRNDHFGYAITWFSLAIIGLVMFGLYYRKQ